MKNEIIIIISTYNIYIAIYISIYIYNKLLNIQTPILRLRHYPLRLAVESESTPGQVPGAVPGTVVVFPH